MQTHRIFIRENWLSDGSAVYSVTLQELPETTNPAIVFDAVDRGAAYRLAEGLQKLLSAGLVLEEADLSDQTYS